MLTTLFLNGIKAFIGIMVIFGGWLLVQTAWRRVFPGLPADEDVLAGRMGCHGCHCATPCKRANQTKDQ